MGGGDNSKKETMKLDNFNMFLYCEAYLPPGRSHKDHLSYQWKYRNHSQPDKGVS